MVRYEVVEKFEQFKSFIFAKHNVEDYLKLNNEIKAYIKSVNASQEEMSEFVNSGAGEMLAMIVSGYEYVKDKQN